MVYSAVSSFSPSIALRCISIDEAHEIIDWVLLDNPQLFYFDLRGYTYHVSKATIVLMFSYLCSKSEMKQLESLIQARAQQILRPMNLSKMSDYEKEKYIHDSLCRDIRYDDVCSENVHIESHTLWGHCLKIELCVMAYRRLLNICVMHWI